jgi:hypothetical protein
MKLDCYEFCLWIAGEIELNGRFEYWENDLIYEGDYL